MPRDLGKVINGLVFDLVLALAPAWIAFIIFLNQGHMLLAIVMLLYIPASYLVCIRGKIILPFTRAGAAVQVFLAIAPGITMLVLAIWAAILGKDLYCDCD